MSDKATRAAEYIPNRPEDIVVWSKDYLGYRWSDDHPMNPTRLDLTMALATDIGVLAGVELVEPVAAPDSELLRFHTSAYIDAVKRAPSQGPALRDPDDVVHGLGSDDNPVFPQMHEASAMLAG